MKKQVLILLALSGVLMATSCTKTNPQVVDNIRLAEGLVMTDPDSANVMLARIELNAPHAPNTPLDRANMARYHLVRTVINDRLGIAHQSADDILATRDYLETTRPNVPDSLLAVANLYVGRVYEYLGQPKEALEALLTAESLLNRTKGNFYWKGRTNYHIGNLYRNDFDYVNAIEYAERAASDFAAAHDSLNMAHSFNLLAFNLRLQGDYAGALESLGKANEIYLAKGNVVGLMSNGLIMSGIHADNLGDSDTAYSLLNGIYALHNNGVVPLSHHPQMSQIEAARGNLKNAIRYLQDYLDSKSNLPLEQQAAYKALLARYYNQARQYSAAYKTLAESVEILDQVEESERETILHEVEARYDKRLLENEYLAYKKVTAYRVVVGAFVLISVIGALFWIMRKRRQKILNLQADLDVLRADMGEFDKMKTHLESVLSKHTAKEERLHEVLKNKMTHIKKMVEYLHLYENDPAKFKRKVQMEIVEAEKNTNFGDLQEIVNEKFAGIINFLKCKYPTLTEDELNLCCLVCFGFTNNQIGILFGHTNPKSIFNKRSTLRQKLGLWPKYESLEAFLSQIATELRHKKETGVSASGLNGANT